MQYRFLIDTNLPIDTEDEEVSSVLREWLMHKDPVVLNVVTR
jgi:predicted nucleic acid-binding protein